MKSKSKVNLIGSEKDGWVISIECKEDKNIYCYYYDIALNHEELKLLKVKIDKKIKNDNTKNESGPHAPTSKGI